MKINYWLSDVKMWENCNKKIKKSKAIRKSEALKIQKHISFLNKVYLSWIKSNPWNEETLEIHNCCLHVIS